MTISDQILYIKIKTLHGKNPTEIHGALSEVCGEFTVDCSMVYHWANPGVFNLLSSRANLHVSYNPAGRSHCTLQNHHG